ncbi:DNA polymerase III, epsilon subunit [Pseudomonas savastanoi]|uniref:DNA polymerase III subunit epsilon n=1 Tax=Pseudomonas savastanoi TaxID=29438 RepID=A0A3M6B2P3_PSESS|nr:DNA polymerase III, epsilon subunit [Pseudomonas savastanoi]
MALQNLDNRSIVLDTETTGMPVTDGHRIIEIGCVELIGRRLTGRHFHVYLQPDRESDEGAIGVHGITNEFLVGKPRFAEVADEFFEFIKGAQLIIHNAAFDVGFINNEFALMGSQDRADITQHCSILDTLMMARERHPGQRNSLDALCKRYGVDNSGRELHGALLDSEILADVYLAMTGGQNPACRWLVMPLTATAPVKALATEAAKSAVCLPIANLAASFVLRKVNWPSMKSV